VTQDFQIRKAEQILQEETGSLRKLSRFESTLIASVAIAWACFQLSLASWLILDSIKVRAIHLAFALCLLFLNYPLFRRPIKWKWLSTFSKIPLLDYCLAGVGIFLALYIVFDFAGLAARMGDLLSRDLLFGIFLIVVLLEAARRSIGPALPVIALLISLYAFFAPYMPELFSAKGVSISKYVNQIALSSEGIFGIPLGVSATIVYLFVLLGALLDKAGAGQFFTTLAVALLGRFRGGPAKAAVVSSGLSGLVSGSSIANIVTTGTFTIPLMKKTGYPAEKAAAIEVAASTNGQLMPPIMGAAAFIIAEYVNVPYLAVVKAAIIPALVSYAALFFLTHLEACKLGIRGLTLKELPVFIKVLKTGMHFFVPLGSLIYELVILRHSTEMAAFHAICILAVIIVYQEIRKSLQQRESIPTALKKAGIIIGQGMIQGSKNMIGVALATAAAGIIVGVVGMGLGSMITQIVEVLALGNIFLLLIITAAASLLLGMGLPTTANYIVMASLTAPIIVTVGGSYGLMIPLIAAHLFVFYFGILADDTPPVGLAAYSAAAIAKSNPVQTGLQGFYYDLRTAMIPFFFVFNTDLLLLGINNWFVGLGIFVMAVGGAFAFTALLQGWFVIKNKWYEIPFFMVATVLLFHPASMHSFVPSKVGVYLIGAGVLVLLWASQKSRQRKEKNQVTSQGN
jgi:TRAP transporter 4TM/12TM fusion protein